MEIEIEMENEIHNEWKALGKDNLVVFLYFMDFHYMCIYGMKFVDG